VKVPEEHCIVLNDDRNKTLNVKAIIATKMTSHCPGTVQMREESESEIKAKIHYNSFPVACP